MLIYRKVHEKVQIRIIFGVLKSHNCTKKHWCDLDERLHLLQAFASLLALVTVKPVHSLISSNHPAAGLPLLLFPSTIPSTMLLSKHGCLNMCPKYPKVSCSKKSFKNTMEVIYQAYVQEQAYLKINIPDFDSLNMIASHL